MTTGPRLPDGFAVQVDRRVRVLGEGSALLGGSPTRLLKLAPAAQTMLSGGRLEVHDAQSAQLARTLLDATVAHPRPASGPSHRDVTIVIPVRDNVSGLVRLVGALRGMRVIVVDDGSAVPVAVSDFDGLHCNVQVLRHAESKGPAAARNSGLAACESDFVAFLDSDVVPRRGWLEALLGHFCDPAVALVAPRIVGLHDPENLMARYEAVRSSLDLGLREAPVVPYGTVSYVPSAAIICRRSALNEVNGFDEDLRSGEDVDLCWRFIEAGARLRYEPIALVGHDHRTELREWFARKAFYGTSAAPLSIRHPGKTAPLVISGWTLLVWVLLAMGSGVGYFASTLVAAFTGRRIAQSLSSGRHRAQGSRGRRGARAVVGLPPVGLRDLQALLADRADLGGTVPPLQASGPGSRDRRRSGRLGYPQWSGPGRREAGRIACVSGTQAARPTSRMDSDCGRASCGNGTSAHSSLKSAPEISALTIDVLVVGAGSAGCVLAERLSSDPSCRVAVVESGPGPSDPHVFAQISDGLRLPIGEASSVVRRFETTLTDRPRRTMSIMRGAVVGGSGAVNGGYFCRGLPADFDSWNLAGWAWKDVLPHFRAIETDLDFDGPLHGSDGPMLIRRVAEFDRGAAAFVSAAQDMGYRRIADLNGVGATEQPAPAVAAVPLNIDDGTRVGPGGAFLAPAMGRPNLSVFEGVRAERVVVAGGHAVGVDCVGSDGRMRLSADRIVLCAGAIGSAHLLMLSGIGPSADLRRAGVSVVQDLPVGVRSADHPEWVLPVDWPAAPGRPPVEAVVMTNGGHEIRPYTTGFGAMAGGSVDDSTDRPHLGVTLLQPRSRGRITLVSPDATVPPAIDHRYDSEPADVTALEAGAEIARGLAGVGYEAREAHWSTSQHLCSTVPMGADEDASPLDEQCRVRGISGLWVVDGSIMPSITSRGPHATIVMIGHRAAEFIVR